jgi:hypothetical protein
MLIEVRRVRIGELAEDQLLATFRALEPHVYSDEEKDRQLAECEYRWDWWNDASHSLPKVTLDSVIQAAKGFVMNLVRLTFSSSVTIN